METKVCKVCHQEKTLSEYPIAKTCKDGVVGTCKQCKHKRAMYLRELKKKKGYGLNVKGVRKCKICLQNKNITNFSRSFNYSSGRDIRCKDCVKHKKEEKYQRVINNPIYAKITKTCTGCKEEKILSAFHKHIGGKYGHHSSCKQCEKRYNAEKYVPHPRIKLTHKTCSHCKQTYPLTDDYWYTKVQKAGTVKGLKTDSISYRNVCKKCNGVTTHMRKTKKRCKELNCSIEDYRSAYLLEQSKKMRKYDYGNVNKVTPVMAAKAARIAMSKSYIAMSLRMPVAVLTDDLYELGKEQIQLKRQIKQMT